MKPAITPLTRWIIQEPDPEKLSKLCSGVWGACLPPLMQRLLAQRGFINVTEAQDYLEPRLAGLGDPFLLPDMTAAVERIFQAVDKKESVILYGDYDVDGVTSLTLMTLVLRAYGLKPECFLPLRMEEGYGLSRDGLARCFEEHGKPGLLLALDCGTGSVAEVAWMNEQGVDCVIVDHHEPGESRPDCVALVNPKLTGEQTYFCTVGLVFKLAHALLKTRRLEDFDLRDHLDLVAMGTVADMVPLRDENRKLVRKGLERLSDTPRPGLRALKTIAGLDGFIQSHHIGFRLGPRLNAAGRLDTAQTALDLLLCEDAQDGRDCAELLDAHNRERQEVEATAQREAEAMMQADPSLADAPMIILGSRAWHPGVVGIVASRIMRDYHRPAIMLAFDENGMGKGSGRSVPGISLVDALNACRPLIEKGGGHAMAAGVSLREENLDAFRKAMQDAVLSQIVTGDELTPTLSLDAEIRLSDLEPDFLSHYTRMEPFGMGNPEPVFICRGVEPLLPGQIIKERHWKLLLRQDGETRPAMWFAAPLQDPPKPPWDIALKVQRHIWRGQESWQLMISEARTSEKVR
jgi:single-stranded-DNA-specific exonuclease